MFYFPKKNFNVIGKPLNLNLCITFEKVYLDEDENYDAIRFYTTNDTYIWRFDSEMDRDYIFDQIQKIFVLGI